MRSTTATRPSPARSLTRRAQRQLHHLLRGLLAVAARFGAEGHAAARPLGRPARALAGTARALLPPRLLATAAHLGPGLRALRAGPGGGQLRRHHLVQHGHVGLDAEDGVVELDGAAAAPAIVRTSTSATATAHPSPRRGSARGRRGAGHRALDEQEVALGVGLDDLQVQRGHPLMADAAGHPRALEHAGGVAHAPMAPGARCTLWAPWPAPIPLKL